MSDVRSEYEERIEERKEAKKETNEGQYPSLSAPHASSNWLSSFFIHAAGHGESLTYSIRLRLGRK